MLFVGLYYRGQRREDLERKYLEGYHPIDERVPRLRQLPDPWAPAARCPAPAKRRRHVPNNMAQCPISIQVFFPYAPPYATRSCEGMESPCVQAEARVRMPLTRSPCLRSVPARSEPLVRRPRGRVEEPSPWSRSSFTVLPGRTVGREHRPNSRSVHVHSAATRGSPHIAVPSSPHISLACAAHQSECGRTPLARGRHKEGPSP